MLLQLLCNITVGYGFAEEYDIQLYYRRAKGWPLQLGDPGLEYQHIANLCLSKEGVV